MKPGKRKPLSELRTFGVAAHIDAGKTTVSERMLYIAGVQYRPGLVDEGTATMDFEEEERERGITIHSAAIKLAWQGLDYTLVDTPGHVDFTVEVERCMRVLDGVIIVFDSSQGVEAQSETVWRQAVAHGVVRIAFLNKLDKVGADWEASVASMRERLAAEPVSVQLPWILPDGEIRLVDLVRRRVFAYSGDRADAEFRSADWSGDREWATDEDWSDPCEGWEAERLALVEAVAAVDEELLDRFVSDQPIEPEELCAAIRRQTLANAILPVLGGAALRGIGVEPLLEAVGDYLPCPEDVPQPLAVHGPPAGKRQEERPTVLDADAPLAAQVFKVVATRHGTIGWVRVYQGTLESHEQVFNPRTEKVERLQGLFIILADSDEAVDKALPGDIVAVKGLKNVQTGDTLCRKKQPVSFSGWEFPLPVISMAVEARKVEDRDRVLETLKLLEIEDPTMDWRVNDETGQLLVSGMGELHLQILAGKLKRDFKLDVLLGSPRVAYREALGRKERMTGRFERVLPNKTVSAWLDVEFVPAPDLDLPTVAVELEDGTEDSAAGRLLVETAIAALKSELSAGPAHGFPMTQVAVTLRGVRESAAEPLPSPEELEIALNVLMRDLGRTGEMRILEPWMQIEVRVPEEHLSSVLGDIQAHGGEIQKVEVQGDLARLDAIAPLSRMLDFTTRLRSSSQGRGSSAMQLERYREVGKEDRERLQV